MEDIAEQDVKGVLDKALADGTITQEQHQKMMAEAVLERPEERGDRMQTVLIATAVTIIVGVVGFSILMAWDNMGYYSKVSLLSILAAGMFIGAVLAKRIEYDKLHLGLLSGASNLFVLAYGYWFYYELHIRESGSFSWYSIEPAGRSLALGIPLLVVPVIILGHLICRNSRLGSQGALLSLLIGCGVFFARAMATDDGFSSDSGFLAIGLIGMAILISAIVINIQWRLGRLTVWKKFYTERLRTFNSLISSCFVLGCLYILMAPAVLDEYSERLINGAIWMTFPAFVAIFYGIETRKEGLVMSACGIIIIATWIAGLGLSESGLCILPLAIITALMLIGIAFLLRRISRHEDKGDILNNP